MYINRDMYTQQLERSRPDKRMNVFHLIAPRRQPGQDCMRPAMKDIMNESMKGLREDERLSKEGMKQGRGEWMKG